MRQVGVTIPAQEWGTLKSKYPVNSGLITLNDFTKGTVNIDTQRKGVITKRKAGVTYNSTAFPAPAKDQYEAIFSDGARHLLEVDSGVLRRSTGDTIFVDVTSGYSAISNFEFATTQDRVYFGNAINAAQVYDRVSNYGGVGYTAPKTKDMGAQAPSAAPSVAVQAGGSIPVGAHTYKVTFLYYGSEESNGGPSSVVATTTGGNQTVDVTNLPIGDYGVTARKIYRDDNDGDYVLAGTVNDNTSTSFLDDGSNIVLTPIPTDHDIPPSFGLIALHLDRVFLAKVPGSPHTLFFSNPSQPDIVPTANQLVCNEEDPITALFVYQDKLHVFNRKSFGQILGKTTDQFRYSSIPGSVGCVDNRTIQVRTINDVPVLIWLSDRGYYSYNGQSVDYISEDIEDLINFNIQQADQQKGQNSQTSQSDFQNGTASPGIDLTTTPGQIRTPNPKILFDDKIDWETGVLVNIASISNQNRISVPGQLSEAPASQGSLSGNFAIAGVGFKIGTSVDFTGQSNFDGGSSIGMSILDINDGQGFVTDWAQPVTPPRAGTLSGFTMRFLNGGSSTATYRLKVWRDAAGNPGAVAFTGGSFSVPGSGDIFNPAGTNASASTSVSVAAGEKIWIGAEKLGPFDLFSGTPSGASSPFGSGLALIFAGGTWHNQNGAVVGQYANLSYTFVASPLSNSAQWLSSIFDTKSLFSVGRDIQHTGVYPAGTTATTIVEAGSVVSGGNLIVETSQVFNNLSGSSTVTITNKRYWRIRIQLSTTDDRIIPSVTSIVTLRMALTGTWTSPAIDTTDDSTLYNALNVINNSVPAGTSVDVTIATSPDDITYTSFVPFGSETVDRYAKIKLVLTKNGSEQTPVTSSVELQWTIVANLISSAIDTGVAPPAGLDIFQATSNGNVLIELRSAASEGALSGATFYAVTNGAFPPATITPLQFVQWRVTLTSTADSISTVNDVTVNWFISIVESIRPASIFHDKRYFCALARKNVSTNDVMLELDAKGNWRQHEGLKISTFSFFFNQPYYGSAQVGTIFRFFEGFKDDAVNNIPIVINTKSTDFTTERFNNRRRLKTLLELILIGTGTGAAYTVSFSLDNGKTFIPMKDEGGTTVFTSVVDEAFERRFRVDYTFGNPVSARTIMFQITTNDQYDIELHEAQAFAWVDMSEPVTTG